MIWVWPRSRRANRTRHSRVSPRFTRSILITATWQNAFIRCRNRLAESHANHHQGPLEPDESNFARDDGRAVVRTGRAAALSAVVRLLGAKLFPQPLSMDNALSVASGNARHRQRHRC